MEQERLEECLESFRQEVALFGNQISSNQVESRKWKTARESILEERGILEEVLRKTNSAIRRAQIRSTQSITTEDTSRESPPEENDNPIILMESTEQADRYMKLIAKEELKLRIVEKQHKKLQSLKSAEPVSDKPLISILEKAISDGNSSDEIVAILKSSICMYPLSRLL